MMFNLADLFQAYLVPFAIAVPIGLLLIFFGLRRGGGDRVADIAEPPPVAGQAETAVTCRSCVGRSVVSLRQLASNRWKIASRCVISNVVFAVTIL